jgi:DNA polymerase III epsilon subunit-like protein
MTLFMSNDTPLLELPIVSLDLETTGLDVVTDRIVQIGMIGVSVGQSELKPVLDSLVNPGIPIPPLSTDIHGITDEDVIGAPPFADISGAITETINTHLVIGHHITYDIAILRHETARTGLDWVEPSSLDLALLAAALEPGLSDHGLDSVADWLSVPISGRHTAMGDSRAVADIFLKLLPLLRQRDVMSLGDARKLLSTREDLLAREQTAGWRTAASRPRESLPNEFRERFRRLREIKNAQVDQVHSDLHDGIPACDIQKRISEINFNLHQEAIGLCVRDELDSGRGGPPVAFEAIMIGSGSRLESLLYPDQDNGFILADVADSDLDAIDRWFEALAKKMTEALAEIGFRYCPGWVMATNPRWRKTLGGFQQQTAEWISVAQGDALHYCNIFLDFKHFHGSGSLANSLREFAVEQARNSRFLSRLYDLHKNHTGALGWFNKIHTDPTPGPNQGKIDLKTAGTLPVVSAIRLLSLHSGVRAESTLERIEQLHKLGVLEKAEELLSAYSLIVCFLLRQQVADHQAGLTMGNHIPPNALNGDERSQLVDALKLIHHFCKRVGKIVRQ